MYYGLVWICAGHFLQKDTVKDSNKMKTFSWTEQNKPNLLLNTEFEFHIIPTLSIKTSSVYSQKVLVFSV